MTALAAPRAMTAIAAPRAMTAIAAPRAMTAITAACTPGYGDQGKVTLQCAPYMYLHKHI